jgi:Phage stabilisation protein
MATIPILSGIYSDSGPDIRTAYPVNMVPVPVKSGLGAGYLRPGDGIVSLGTGPGVDRGGICWKGTCYRVMGSKLVSIPAGGGAAIEIGDVGGTDSQVQMDYSFDHLAVVSDNNLYLYDGSVFGQNTDPDLGSVLDVIYVDGYFLLTDGQYLIVTELGDPYAVDSDKYGSSEVDPDPVVGLLKINNEPYAVNRFTIEIFQNIGGELFPFQRVEGTRIDKGAIGTTAFCYFMGNLAFLGSGRNEAPGVYLGLNAEANKISSREVDQILLGYSEAALSTVLLETKVDESHNFLLIHLPDQCLVFDGAATAATGMPVWFVLSSALIGKSRYRAKNHVWNSEKWIVGDPESSNYGYLDNTISTHWGERVGWEVSTDIIYNQGRGAIVHELELVALPGRVALGINPTIWTSYSADGMTWSIERAISAGLIGDRLKRMRWMQQGFLSHWRIQKFRGTSDAHLSITGLEARLEGLEY